MAKIIEHKEAAVTLGVLDRTLDVHPDLQQVTFEDVLGTRHTVHAHREGPFKSPEDIVQAWHDGVLHAHESHEAAVKYAEEHNDTVGADRLRELIGHDQPQGEQAQGGGY